MDIIMIYGQEVATKPETTLDAFLEKAAKFGKGDYRLKVFVPALTPEAHEALMEKLNKVSSNVVLKQVSYVSTRLGNETTERWFNRLFCSACCSAMSGVEEPVCFVPFNWFPIDKDWNKELDTMRRLVDGSIIYDKAFALVGYDMPFITTEGFLEKNGEFRMLRAKNHPLARFWKTFIKISGTSTFPFKIKGKHVCAADVNAQKALKEKQEREEKAASVPIKALEEELKKDVEVVKAAVAEVVGEEAVEAPVEPTVNPMEEVVRIAEEQRKLREKSYKGKRRGRKPGVKNAKKAAKKTAKKAAKKVAKKVAVKESEKVDEVASTKRNVVTYERMPKNTGNI